MDGTRSAALEARAWPFEEARRLVRRYADVPPAKGHVLFETGYGPSGLPHIGTFGEVARTTMVRRAFETMSDIPTKLICFSDDMDGLRKVPGNVPMQEEMRADLNLPADPGARPLRHPRELRRAQQRAAAGRFSTPSASTTNSPAPPSIIARAGSTRCCCGCWNASTR